MEQEFKFNHSHLTNNESVQKLVEILV